MITVDSLLDSESVLEGEEWEEGEEGEESSLNFYIRKIVITISFRTVQ